MNERIRLLVEQAGITTNLDTEYFEKDMNKWVDYFSEKFAELMVKECIEVCNSRIGNSDYNTGRMHCASDLKQHFGVER